LSSLDDLKKRAHELRERLEGQLASASDPAALQAVRDRFLGRKAGEVTALFKDLGKLAAEARKEAGEALNALKEFGEAKIGEAEAALERRVRDSRLASERIDVSLPGRARASGSKHPLTLVREEVEDVFIGMGFDIFDGPEVDDDFHCFEALNMPADHPARDMQDTFYLSPELLLRTHTSNVQVHAMENFSPPIRIIAPGRCFRNEDISARSHVFFHQVEGFYIDKHVTFADLFSTMDEFLTKLLGEQVQTRYRPSYFPFVEPGLEVDVSCISCKGTGCRICKHTGWLEILGAGMIHPNVLKRGGIDPEQYSGYAWGMGVERLTMLLNDIRDIRQFTENDLRFLEQFP
jgi:phenylalanyl-tRNA synthetase alpha chain